MLLWADFYTLSNRKQNLMHMPGLLFHLKHKPGKWFFFKPGKSCLAILYLNIILGIKLIKKNTSLKFYCTDTAKTDLSDFENASLLNAFWSSKKIILFIHHSNMKYENVDMGSVLQCCTANLHQEESKRGTWKTVPDKTWMNDRSLFNGSITHCQKWHGISLIVLFITCVDIIIILIHWYHRSIFSCTNHEILSH